MKKQSKSTLPIKKKIITVNSLRQSHDSIGEEASSYAIETMQHNSFAILGQNNDYETDTSDEEF